MGRVLSVPLSGREPRRDSGEASFLVNRGNLPIFPFGRWGSCVLVALNCHRLCGCSHASGSKKTQV